MKVIAKMMEIDLLDLTGWPDGFRWGVNLFVIVVVGVCGTWLFACELHFSLDGDGVALYGLQDLSRQIGQEWKRFVSASNKFDPPGEVIICGEYAAVPGVVGYLRRYLVSELGGDLDGVMEWPVGAWEFNTSRSGADEGAIHNDASLLEQEVNLIKDRPSYGGFELAIGLALRGLESRGHFND